MLSKYQYEPTKEFGKGWLFKTSLLTFIYLSFNFIANASVVTNNNFQNEVQGVISDDTGQPIPGANIVVKGTTQGTVADFDGNYSIMASGNATLIFSAIGFVTREIEVAGQSNIDIALATDTQLLDEVVVVGYGTTKKSDITGSVSSVKAEEISAFPVLDAVSGLQGRAAGVDIQSTNGEPGSPSRIRIRGGTSINASSNPLFVIDGFAGGVLPPAEDIESIEILKDASATAIYGSRGANGVILVTTKKGVAGKMAIDLNISQSAQRPTNTLDLLGVGEFGNYVREANPDYVSRTGNTDWQDEVYRTGEIRNIQLAVSGGSEKTNYYVSGTIFDQKGIVINSDYERFSITSNINSQVTDRLKVGANLFVRRTERDGVTSQESSGGPASTSVVAGAFLFQPDLNIFNNDGDYTLSQIREPYDNPVAIARELIINELDDLLQSNFYGEYQIFDGLKFKTTLGYSVVNSRDGNYNPTILQAGRNANGQARVVNRNNTNWLSENYLTFNQDWENHSLEILGGYSYQGTKNEAFVTNANNFINDSGNFYNLGASENSNLGSNLTETELVSYYGRLNYSLFNRYLLTFNARYDGSSAFSADNKYGFFPSGAFAWNMKNETFLKDNTTINQWKWRVSYGRTGNRSVNAYGTLASFQSLNGIQNNEVVNAIIPSNVANQNLEWEFTDQLNIGLDLGLFKNRLSLTADYYDMLTSNLLFPLPLPEYTGFSQQLVNIGEVSNKGFELGITTQNIVGEKFNWSTTLNFSTNENRIESLPEGNDIIRTTRPGHMVGLSDNQILREGEPVGAFFGYTYDGVYQEGDTFLEGAGLESMPGGERFRDLDSRGENGELTGQPDGVVNEADRRIIGDPTPDFTWGFNNDLNWNGFDMNIFFQGSQGNDIMSFTLQELNLLRGSNNTTVDAFDNRWTPTNTDTDVPVVNNARGYRASSRFVQDGSYIRLKNLAIGYSLPRKTLESFGMSKLRIYVSAQNILTITDYEGYDPETNYRNTGSNQNNNINLGLDYASYPNARTITLGLNLGF